jgi:molybdopterin adenylyltransferase
MDYLREVLTGPWCAVPVVVPDDARAIRGALESLCREQACCLIITTGGTGPGPRDITPEVTADFCDKLLPGLGERMRAASVDRVPTAILSRQAAGIRGKALIVNLPGSPRAIAECLDAVFPAIPDCLDVIGAGTLTTNERRFVAPRRH